MKLRFRSRWVTDLLVVALTAGIVTIAGGCGTLLVPEEPDEPIYDNPIDPDSPAHVAPETDITDGPSDGSTVTSSSVTFGWRGNTGATMFQIRVTGGAYGTDWQAWSGMFADGWSPWTTDRSVTLNFLDELTYTFQVRAGYPSNFIGGDPSEWDNTPESSTFTVNAVTGPALRLSPRVTPVSLNGTFDIDIVADGVTDLAMLNLRIVWNSSRIQYISEWDQGPFLSSNGGDVLPLGTTGEEASGVWELAIGVAGGTPPGVSGTGVIATLHFRAIATGIHTMAFVSSSTELRDPNNNPISPTGLIAATVIVP
ncbi:cohesin domain-containing protein [Gemmatimonadota bacterium]